MASTSNILLDPIPELTTALTNNSWGIDPSSEVLVAESFPITAEDKEAVRSEIKKKGVGSSRVVGKARVGTLEGGWMIIVLDQRGYTLESSTDLDGKTYPNETFETLEALLIAKSPLYVEAMTREVGKRFEGYSAPDHGEHEEQGEKEERMAEGGEQEVWR